MGKLLLTTNAIIGLVAVILLILILIGLTVYLNIRKYKRKTLKDLSGVEKKDNTRYSIDTAPVSESGEAQVTIAKSDITLIARRTYTVGKNNKIIPGQYTVLVTSENDTKVYIRVNNVTKEYEHNTKIILSDGESICAVSTSVILR